MKTFEQNQQREQAGYRSRYSTKDKLQGVNHLKGVSRCDNISLCIAFVNYWKA